MGKGWAILEQGSTQSAERHHLVCMDLFVCCLMAHMGQGWSILEQGSTQSALSHHLVCMGQEWAILEQGSKVV